VKVEHVPVVAAVQMVCVRECFTSTARTGLALVIHVASEFFCSVQVADRNMINMSDVSLILLVLNTDSFQ